MQNCEEVPVKLCFGTECTKIAHRRSLAIFTADEGIAGNSAARTIFTHFLRRRNRGSLAIFFAEEIAHLGASKRRAIFWGAVKIAAAAAENRAILVHSALAAQRSLAFFEGRFGVFLEHFISLFALVDERFSGGNFVLQRCHPKLLEARSCRSGWHLGAENTAISRGSLKTAP